MHDIAATARGSFGLHLPLGAALGAAVFMSACSASLGLGGPGVTYAPSSIISPAGYSHTEIDPTHFTVRATGSNATPAALVETLARARAAEIGIENKQRWFKVAGVTHGFRCVEKKDVYKGPSLAANQYPIATLDVLYDNRAAAPDASWLPSAESFERLKGELASPPPQATLAEANGPTGKSACASKTQASNG